MSADHHDRVKKLLAIATAVVPDGMDEAQRQAAVLACRMIVKHDMLAGGGPTFSTTGGKWTRPPPASFHQACFPGCRECYCLDGHEDHCKNRGAP